jgi:chromosome segregation ATPase
MLTEHRKELQAHAEQTRWARELAAQLKDAQRRIVELQDEFTEHQKQALEAMNAYEQQISSLEHENDEKTQWALELDQRLNAEIARLQDELSKAVQALNAYDQELTDRTHWAQRLAAEMETLRAKKEALEAQVKAVRTSRWVRAGRVFGIGPVLQ